jgi:polyhydroxyalkanoate synthase
MDKWKETESRRWKNFLSQWTKPVPTVNPTPREAIWKKNKATLWYYPARQKRYHTPLFLIYSTVNQPFILDLSPEMSLIEALAKEGYDVYLIDFGIPGFEDKDLTLDQYITDYIQKGVRRALRHSKAKELSIMGFCLGGTLAAIYAAIAEEPIRNLILSVAPIDFQTMPAFDKWVDALRKNELDFQPFFETIGLVPALMMRAGMRLLTSPIYVSPYLSLLNRAYDEEYLHKWHVFNYWTRSHIPFPGAAMNQVTRLVADNQLMNGTLSIDHQFVYLENISANLLVISTTHDRLVPKEQSMPILEKVASTDTTFELLQGGHTMLTKDGVLPIYLKNWLAQRSESIH